MSGSVWAAVSSGNSAAYAVREQCMPMPRSTPSTQAMANPHTPSMNVMQVAGQRVGHEMIAERTICVGEETIVTGGWAASTQTCQMSSSATTVTTVGQCLHACRRGRSV